MCSGAYVFLLHEPGVCLSFLATDTRTAERKAPLLIRTRLLKILENFKTDSCLLRTYIATVTSNVRGEVLTYSGDH